MPTSFARPNEKKGICTHLGQSGRRGQSLGLWGGGVSGHPLRARSSHWASETEADLSAQRVAWAVGSGVMGTMAFVATIKRKFSASLTSYIWA